MNAPPPFPESPISVARVRCGHSQRNVSVLIGVMPIAHLPLILATDVIKGDINDELFTTWRDTIVVRSIMGDRVGRTVRSV
jgi:hypothetical protein